MENKDKFDNEVYLDFTVDCKELFGNMIKVKEKAVILKKTVGIYIDNFTNKEND